MGLQQQLVALGGFGHPLRQRHGGPPLQLVTGKHLGLGLVNNDRALFGGDFLWPLNSMGGTWKTGGKEEN